MDCIQGGIRRSSISILAETKLLIVLTMDRTGDIRVGDGGVQTAKAGRVGQCLGGLTAGDPPP